MTNKISLCTLAVFTSLLGIAETADDCACLLHFKRFDNDSTVSNPDTLLISPGEYANIMVTVWGGCCDWQNGFNFQWYHDNVIITDTALVNYGFSTRYNVTEPGVYYIEVIPISGPTYPVSGFEFVVIDPTYIEPFTEIELYPNPTAGDFTIEYSLDNSSNIEYRLTDISGKEVLRESHPDQLGYISKSFDFSSYSAGFYWLSTISHDWIITKKIVKQ